MFKITLGQAPRNAYSANKKSFIFLWLAYVPGEACGMMSAPPHALSYSRNGMIIFVLLLYSGYALGKVAARFRSSTIPQ